MDAGQWWARMMAAQEKRARDYPTEDDCIAEMSRIHERLKDLGWRDGEAPHRNGTVIQFFELGCSVKGVAEHLLNGYFTAEAGDLWPVRPTMWRRMTMDDTKQTASPEEIKVDQPQTDPDPVLVNEPGTLTGLPVAGYKAQDEVTVALVNKNKEIEERLLRQCEALRDGAPDNGADPRLAAMAFTDLQKAFMLLNRAIFNPDRAKLPEDKA